MRENGVINVDHELTPAELEELHRAWVRQYIGLREAHVVRVTGESPLRRMLAAIRIDRAARDWMRDYWGHFRA